MSPTVRARLEYARARLCFSNADDSTMPGAGAPKTALPAIGYELGGFVDRPGRREAAGMAFALKRRALRALIITSLAKPSVSGRCSYAAANGCLTW